MAACAFLGDEVSGLGFRLAGVEVHCPESQEVRALFLRLREETRVIVMTAEIAAALPPDLLRDAELATWPLVLVIPDVRNRVAAPDLVAEVRRRLGMAE
ncbi:V-type ATP synthase subunit F [Thiocapsa roseopersicina]|uniref:H+-ATPase subunit F/Vma7 n=1 Tax=Thiocapsa roseopersicina TaxID=1058 RepID=A0A1H2SV06_THIRO|nr:V-type ATP synthase subunit F [Thiocapsa roseopersicina]SDW35367.1 H+-ATPase subunit F/Vma7 [Thiocapsa roseopersicina]